METFLFLLFFIVMSILSIVGRMLFRYLLAKATIGTVNNYASQFAREQRQFAALITQVQQQPHSVSPEQSMQMLTLMQNMKSNVSHMQSIQREQYETKLGGMISDAASAGIFIDRSDLP